MQVGDDDPPAAAAGPPPLRYLTTLDPLWEGAPRPIIAVPGLTTYPPPGGGAAPSVIAVPGLTIYTPTRVVHGPLGIHESSAGCW